MKVLQETLARAAAASRGQGGALKYHEAAATLLREQCDAGGVDATALLADCVKRLNADLYLALGAARGSPANALKPAYRKLCLLYHPDKSPKTTELFQIVQRAWEILSDEPSKQRYDRALTPASGNNGNAAPQRSPKRSPSEANARRRKAADSATQRPYGCPKAQRPYGYSAPGYTEASTPPSPLRTPTGLRLMERCAETISVRWDGCDGAALYQIQFRKFASHWPSTQQRVRTAACRKKNLDADCTYEIRVRGVSVAGDTSEYSTPLVSKTLPDLAKDALKADRAKDAADDVRAAALERAQREAADALQRAKARAADKAAAADTAQRAAAAEPSAEPPSPPADSDRAGAVPRLKLSWNCGVCERSNALGLSSCRVCSMPRSYCNEKLTSLKEVWQSCVTDDFRSARAAAADFASGAARKRPSRDEDAPSPRKKSAPPHAAREPHTSDAAAVSRPTARGTMARDAVAHPASARATSAQPASARAAGARPTSSRDAAAHPASARAAIPQLPAARHTSFYFDGADAPRDAASFDGRPASLVPSPQARKSDATRSPRTTGSPRLAVAKGKQTQSSPYLARLGTRGAKSVPRAAPAVDGTSSGGLSTGASTADSSGVANFDRPMRPLASAPRRKGNPKHVSKDPRPLKKAPSVTRGVKCVGHVGRWLRKKCSPDGNRQSSNESDESEDAPTLASLPLDRLASLSGAASNVSAWFEVLGPGEDRVYYHGATAAKADAAPNGAPQWYAMASSPEHASAVFAAGAAATPAFYWHAATGATQWDRPLDDAKQPLPYWAEVDVRDAAFADVKIYCWHAAEWRGLF